MFDFLAPKTSTDGLAGSWWWSLADGLVVGTTTMTAEVITVRRSLVDVVAQVLAAAQEMPCIHQLPHSWSDAAA